MTPLYAVDSGTESKLSTISISDPDTRVEQQVRNDLVFLMTGGEGLSPRPQYNLVLKTTASSLDVLEKTAARLTVTVGFTLTERDTDRLIVSGERSAVASLDVRTQQFAKDRAILDAENRAAREVAALVYADLAAAISE